MSTKTTDRLSQQQWQRAIESANKYGISLDWLQAHSSERIDPKHAKRVLSEVMSVIQYKKVKGRGKKAGPKTFAEKLFSYAAQTVPGNKRRIYPATLALGLEEMLRKLNYKVLGGHHEVGRVLMDPGVTPLVDTEAIMPIAPQPAKPSGSYSAYTPNGPGCAGYSDEFRNSDEPESRTEGRLMRKLRSAGLNVSHHEKIERQDGKSYIPDLLVRCNGKETVVHQPPPVVAEIKSKGRQRLVPVEWAKIAIYRTIISPDQDLAIVVPKSDSGDSLRSDQESMDGIAEIGRYLSRQNNVLFFDSEEEFVAHMQGMSQTSHRPELIAAAQKALGKIQEAHQDFLKLCASNNIPLASPGSDEGLFG